MSSLFTREGRIIWTRRIKGFWEEFRVKRIGLVGLSIIGIFVVMALLAPWLTPYDPLAMERVADGFALPEWIRIFPQFKDLSTTRTTFVSWERTDEGYAYVQEWGRDILVNFEAQTTDSVTVVLTSKYPYSQKIPPDAFYFEFEWKTEGVKDLKYLLKLFMVDPNGTSTMIWIVPGSWRDVDTGEAVHVDSTNWELLKRLGLQLGVDNLARDVFAVEEGDYTFILQMLIRPQTSDAECTIHFTDTTFITLGHVHGILGCDNAGSDIWAQLVYGARVSLVIGILAALISTSIGITVGITAGYIGGVVDETVMRIVDILLCLPLLPLLLALVALFGKSVFYIVLFVAIFGWQGLSRVIRSSVLSLRENTFIECAKAAGGSKFYIMIKHLLPNVLPIAFASLVLSVPSAILFEASLSFLGFGDPRAPTWGKMLHHAFGFGGFSHLAWWWILPPGLAITFLCLAFVFMGHAVDEVVNPRLRRRR